MYGSDWQLGENTFMLSQGWRLFYAFVAKLNKWTMRRHVQWHMTPPNSTRFQTPILDQMDQQMWLWYIMIKFFFVFFCQMDFTCF
jgi:hypothetical protein